MERRPRIGWRWQFRIAFGVAAIWQFVSWGGRISLLTEAERFDWMSWTRIGGSLVFGALLLLVALGGRRTGFAKWVAFGFLAFSLLTWGRSLMNVWGDPVNTMAFNLVHSVLAVTTWVLGVWTVWISQAGVER
ncbi:MAG: hypothetical protein JSV07_03710 [Acidimicrobiia bacterium]|nr:MAG: hypothetical protein JSV07_03710 [Acidimicrobiia bacterium]